MSLIRVLLDIPGFVEAGLGQETLTRDAAGIIRIAAGQPGGGQIVTHLREGAAISGFDPAPALMAFVQLAQMAYMRAEFHAVHGMLARLQLQAADIAEDVREIRDRSRDRRMDSLRRAIAYLVRFNAGHGDDWRQQAHRAFVDAQTELRAELERYTGEDMVADAGYVEDLLGALALAVAGEAQCLAQNDPAQWMAIGGLRAMIDYVRTQVASIPPPSRRIPALKMLRAGQPVVIQRELVEVTSRAEQLLGSTSLAFCRLTA